MSFCFFFLSFSIFLVTAITSVEGTFHSVFFFLETFGRLCRSHCHLQCFDTQLDPTSVRGLSQYFGSSCLFVCVW